MELTKAEQLTLAIEAAKHGIKKVAKQSGLPVEVVRHHLRQYVIAYSDEHGLTKTADDLGININTIKAWRARYRMSETTPPPPQPTSPPPSPPQAPDASFAVQSLMTATQQLMPSQQATSLLDASDPALVQFSIYGDNPWDRVLFPEPEPMIWFTRFEQYRLTGPHRTIIAVYKTEDEEVRGAKNTWYNMAKLWRWSERAEAFDTYELMRLRYEREVSRLNSRNARVQLLQGAFSIAVGCTKNYMAMMDRAKKNEKEHLPSLKDLTQLIRMVTTELRTEHDDNPRARVSFEGLGPETPTLTLSPPVTSQAEETSDEHLAEVAAILHGTGILALLDPEKDPQDQSVAS